MGFVKWWTKHFASGGEQLDRSRERPAGVVHAWPTSAAQPRLMAPVPRPVPRPLVRLSTDGRVSVVGESHYQPALRAAAAGRVCDGGFDEAIEVTALLVPEPDNPYDRWAVRVDALTSAGAMTVGYLAATVCRDYQAMLIAATPSGGAGWCPGKIMGGGDRYYGIHLHLAGPETLLFTGPAPPPDAQVLSAEHMVTVTGEERHLDALAPLAPAAAGVARVLAHMDWCTVQRGKSAGSRAVEVRIGGQRVGQLTAAATAKYAAMLDAVHAAGGTPACEALIMDTTRGLQVELRMPRA